MPWDEGLTGQAFEIASCNRSPLRVVAGPGTGKTFALKRRVARLLEANVPPERILVVTFTRMAAKDLEREISLLNTPGADKVHKRTLHSLCLSILNSANVFQITGRKSRLLMDYEMRFLLEDLGVDASEEHRENFYKRKRKINAFEAAWAREQDQEPGWPHDEDDRYFHGILREWLIFHESALVGELINLTIKYLQGNPACPQLRYYHHILVDEYQDLNRAEQHLIDLLSTASTLTIVGDEDQSIYESFRFAHPEGISNFHETHENTYDIPLRVCRRCPTSIVALASELIRNNLRRQGHPLQPHDGNGRGNIHIVQWENYESEIEGLAEYISRKVASGEFDPGKTLVLCPRKQFGYSIRDTLRNKGCPAYSFFMEELLDGNPKSVEDSKAQQAFTLLSLLSNPNDPVSLRCWLGFGSDGLRANEYRRIRDYCSKNGITVFQALELALRKELRLANIRGSVERFSHFKDIQEKFANSNAIDVFNQLFPEGELWAEPFRQIVRQNEIVENLIDLFKMLQTNIIQPEIPSTVDYVRVMSLHKSKGLNADHVIIMGCIEGILPQAPDDQLPFEDQRRYIEEQRRLFYVAITRAKYTLVLSSFLSLPISLAHRIRVMIVGENNGHAETIASTFLLELGPNSPRAVVGGQWLLEEVREIQAM